MSIENNFGDYSMLCISTENNTVNIIPVMQFNVKSVIILSTKRAEAEGWTARMKSLLKSKGIEDVNVISVGNFDEKDISSLSEKLFSELSDKKKIIFNISGGQKVLTLVVYELIKRRNERNEDYFLYVEGNLPAIYLYNSQLQMFSTDLKSTLSLDDILYLYGSKRTKEEEYEIFPNLDDRIIKELDTGRKALNFFIKNTRFRELFYNYMKDRLIVDASEFMRTVDVKESIKTLLNQYSKNYVLTEFTSEEFRNMVNLIRETMSLFYQRNYKALKVTFEKLSKIDFDKVFGELKSSICRKMANDIINGFLMDEILLINDLTEAEFRELKSIIEEIGGKVKNVSGSKLIKRDIERFSYIESPGRLFEYMVASKICDILNLNNRVASVVESAHLGVKLSKLENNVVKNDSELDIVITTKYGTLIVLEMKTFKLSGDTAKSREYIAKSRSGPYGRAIIVSPILSTEKKMENGEIKYPEYIPHLARSQEKIALSSGIKFWHLDEFEEKFIKEVVKE